MRFLIPLVALSLSLVGCSSLEEGEARQQTIFISSQPTGAAIRLDGEVVGRTPATITVNTDQDYELTVGKGGYKPVIATLKPKMRKNAKGEDAYGFPEKIKVTLTKNVDSKEVDVPDSPESMAESAEEMQQSIAKIKDRERMRNLAAEKRLQDLEKSVAQNPDAEKIVALQSSIEAQRKANEEAANNSDELIKALSERSEKLMQLSQKAKNPQAAEDREEAAKLYAETKEMMEKTLAEINAKTTEAIAAQKAAQSTNAELGENTANLLKALQEHKEEKQAKMFSTNNIKAKPPVSESDEDREEAEKIYAEARKVAGAPANEKSGEIETQLAQAKAEAAAAKAEAKRRIYAEFNSRVALLENRQRYGDISEEEFKEQLAALRKELEQ
ncbi:MAG: PEGA domain-containing protein [Verrucomicrobia bacterium]|nr:PEGA domain-containing protein [Verrucomicrobiota bacterium]